MNNFLHPFGDLDVLGWYGKVAPYLKKFLQGKEIASKIVSDTFILIKRGTKYPPLFIDDFKGIDEKYLQLRVKYHLDEVVNQLSPKQIDLWQYFVPRKLIDFFYATNNEHGNDIDRIFIDIDRQDNSADDARIVTNELIKTIISDIQFAELIAFTTLILRT